MINKEISDKARDIINFVETAVGEAAYEMEIGDIEMWYGRKLAIKAMKMKKSNPMYWKDGFADMLYNEVDVVSDLVGDRIYDAGESEEQRVMIANAIIQQASCPALQQACYAFLKRHNHQEDGGE